MIFLHPIQSVCNQIIAHLRSAVIINQGSPVRMKSLSGILMLIQTGSVKSGKPIGIPRKMRRHPVENHTDPRPVHLIHKVHEIFRRTVTRGRRIIADHLIAPGFVQRMLHHRHQLNMGISHLFHIINYFRRKFPVTVKLSAVGGLLKGAKIQLVNAHGLIFRLRRRTLLKPLAVLPRKTIDIPNNRGALRSKLRSEAIGICLQKYQPAFHFNFIFIAFPLFHIRNEYLKNSGIPKPSHLMGSAVPAVKIAYHADTQGIWRPHCKISA